MKDTYIQPAATIAAVLLQRMSPKEELTDAVISSAFIQAYQSLEDADQELARTYNQRAAKRFDSQS